MPETGARRRFSLSFYLTAVPFIVFDVEAIFIYPWAVLLKQLKLFGLIEMAIFIGILFVGLVYAWGKGALEWESRSWQSSSISTGSPIACRMSEARLG